MTQISCFIVCLAQINKLSTILFWSRSVSLRNVSCESLRPQVTRAPATMSKKHMCHKLARGEFKEFYCFYGCSPLLYQVTVSSCEKYIKSIFRQKTNDTNGECWRLNIKFQQFFLLRLSFDFNKKKWRNFYRWLGAQRIRQLMMIRSPINYFLTTPKKKTNEKQISSETINISIRSTKHKKRALKMWKQISIFTAPFWWLQSREVSLAKYFCA